MMEPTVAQKFTVVLFAVFVIAAGIGAGLYTNDGFWFALAVGVVVIIGMAG